MSYYKAPGIMFSDLVGDGQEGLTMERVESLLSRVTQGVSERAQVEPYKLVRVCHDGRIVWMTQSQASEFLDQPDNDNKMKREVQRALQGELMLIRQELEILLALAQYTLNHFKQTQAIGEKEISRIEPMLSRRKHEINESFSETAQHEMILAEKRRRNPLLDEYEELMGKFLNEKASGNHQIAVEFAKQLAAKKKKYLLLARAIEPDIRTVHYYRLNLQKLKKRLLNSQNDICSTRMDFLQIEIKALQSALSNVKQQISDAEAQGPGSATHEIIKMSLSEGEAVQQKIEDKVQEYSALGKETAIIAKQEQQVDSLIQHISENVLQEVEQKFSMEQVKSSGQKIQMESNKAPQNQAAKRASGMHFNRER